MFRWLMRRVARLLIGPDPPRDFSASFETPEGAVLMLEEASLFFDFRSFPPEDETTPKPVSWSILSRLIRDLSALRVPRVRRMGLSHKVIPAPSFFKGKNATASVFPIAAH